VVPAARPSVVASAARLERADEAALRRAPPIQPDESLRTTFLERAFHPSPCSPRRMGPPELRWFWSITAIVPATPGVTNSTAATREEAKAKFRDNWSKAASAKAPNRT
jgi:hypothetical protein